MRLHAVALAALACIATTAANVEKTIFLGPGPAALPVDPLDLPDLHLHALSPSSPLLATSLAVHFPSAPSPRGTDSWYLLHALQPGRRYEVRVCWPATSPTDFWLDTFPLSHVLDSPPLAASLAHHSDNDVALPPFSLVDTHEPRLLLRIQSAASFFTTNHSLMAAPPPVNVDIILDPFVLNVLPRSLVPVGVYIIAVAIGAWFLSSLVVRQLAALAAKTHAD